MAQAYPGNVRATLLRAYGLVCQRCGFVATDPVQIEVHHRDRNHRNNTPENLEWICCNCHALEHRVRPQAKRLSPDEQRRRLVLLARGKTSTARR